MRRFIITKYDGDESRLVFTDLAEAAEALVETVAEEFGFIGRPTVGLPTAADVQAAVEATGAYDYVGVPGVANLELRAV